MDIRRALTFAVADASWLSKGGLGAAISLVPILNVAAIGYGSRVARRVAGGQDSDLPTWDDLGALFREGTPLALAQSLYTLPLAGLLCLPLSSAWLLLPTSGEVEALRDRTPALLLLCGAGLALFLVGWLLLSAISPAIMANYVRVGGFASCFEVRALARLISADPGNYLRAVATLAAVGVGASVVIGPLAAMLSFIPCLGYIAYLLLYGAFFFYALLVQGHIVGQLLRAAAEAPR